MAIAQRSPSGRARSRYDRLELYEVVREVALAAAEQAQKDGERLDPLLLVQDEWDKARAESAYPDAPSARQVCWRLRDLNGKPFAWRELLELVFDADADIQQVEVVRTRRPRLERVSGDAVWYSLRRIAAQRSTLTLDEYAQGYEQLIAKDRRRRNGAGGALAEALLTPGQLLHLCGSWPDALRRAGLEVRDEHYTAGRVSLQEGALRFTQEVGALPTARLLRFYARQQGFALEDVDYSKSWATHISDFRAYIQEQGLPEPPAYVPAETSAAWNRWLDRQAEHAAEDAGDTAEPDGADPSAAAGGQSASAGASRELQPSETRKADAGESAHADQSRDEPMSSLSLSEQLLDAARARPRRRERAYQPKRFWRRRSEVLEQLRLFLEWELPSAEAKRTTAIYTRWAREEPGRPSLDSVQKFGPLDKLLREARQADAIERAREQEAREAEKAPAARVDRLHRKHAESRKGRELLTLLGERGEMSRRELEQELGWPQRTVNGYLKWLEEAGAIEKLGETNRTARYRAT